MNYLEYINGLVSRGIWSFTTREMAMVMGNSTQDKLKILRKKGRIITPTVRFHVVVPEEYLNSERLPPDRFVHQMMEFYQKPYYVGLLMAATYWGSSHQSPQSFQVITNYDRRNITTQKNQINFYRKKNMELVPVIKQKSPTGYFNISSPEITFFDLVLFNRQFGGLSRAGEITSELSDHFSMKGLKNTLPYFSNAIIQRCGYILELLGMEKYCNQIEKHLLSQKVIYAYLNPSKSMVRENRYPRWKLFINDSLNMDL